MNTNSELRNLTDEEVDAVTGAVMCNKVMDNEWSQWIGENFKVFLEGPCMYP